MAELGSETVEASLGLPVTAGAVTLAAATGGRLFAVVPFRGSAAAVAAAFGLPSLPTGEVAATPAGRLVWAGAGSWLAEAVPAGLDGLAAVAEVGDGWCRLALGGTAARAVLARLVPLDLDAAAFADGRAARSLLNHEPMLLLRDGESFEIWLARSGAATAAHEIGAAMRGVAARQRLDATGRPG